MSENFKKIDRNTSLDAAQKPYSEFSVCTEFCPLDHNWLNLHMNLQANSIPFLLCTTAKGLKKT